MPPAPLPHTGFNFTSTLHNDTYPAIDPTKHSDLSGKHVFITGASKGIGRATALSYAKAGASVIGLGARSSLSFLEQEIQDAAKAVGKPAPKIFSVQLDVSDQQSVEAATKEVEQAFDHVDILINNAGYLENWQKIADSDPSDWWKTWEINIKGVYLTTRSFLPLLLKSTHKTIVNLSSIGAHVLQPGASAYQSTKFALLRLTEFTAAEYGEQGVVAFAVHPGGVPTELANGMPREMHVVLKDTPELAADTMVWLTAERREWLAGRYVSCTWDMPELLEKRERIVEKNLLKMRMAVDM